MRRLMIGSLLLGVLAGCGDAATHAKPAAPAGSPGMMIVYKSPTCGCCHEWVAYVRRHGFAVEIRDTEEMAPLKTQHGIPLNAQSCHTALLGGYVLEGHVPAEDIEWLLAERPAITGLAVSGMPLGSPGMEMPGGQRDAFDTLAIAADGATSVFASH
ncbi:MAG TPA: DUF411 domain-containing protein [Herpetosiphonaceae bacterium]